MRGFHRHRLRYIYHGKTKAVVRPEQAVHSGSGREMKRHLRRTSVRVVLVVVSAFGAVLLTVDTVWSMQEPKEVARMSKQMKTVCVGRLLIDVPSEAVVTFGSAAVDHFRITNHGIETDEQFSFRLSKREVEINEKKNQAGARNMERIDEVDHDGVMGKIFVFGRTSTYVFHGDKKVVYLGVEVNGYAHVNGMTFSFISNDYDPAKSDNLARLLKQLQPLGHGEIPTQAGFCLDGALLRDPLTADQAETIVMFAGLSAHEDVGIALSTMAGKTPGPGLIERNDANRAGPYAYLNIFTSTLLKGPRTIDGLQGDEFALKARELNFTTGYAFDWETQGTEDNVLRPFVSLELQTGISPRAGGEPLQSTLSEESLGDLWRRMSSSLRVRPVEMPGHASEADEELSLALGTLAWAGQPCQQSGWWRCSDGDAQLGVFGGDRQFLREGATMPQALLLPKPTAWQKVRGVQSSYEARTPTSWRLADKRVHGRRAPHAGLAEPAAAAPAALAERDVALAVPGRTLRSAEVCPASGWWRCVDEQALDGTRWFALGAVLPPATYRFSSGASTSLGRRVQLMARQSAWQLMRIAVAPMPAVA
jgi:hypothetical protein